MQLNAAQCSSIHLQRTQAQARPLGERSEPLQFQRLCCSLLTQSAGRCLDMFGAAVRCWGLLRSVLKLIKFKARFPFFVRQVSLKTLRMRFRCAKYCLLWVLKMTSKFVVLLFGAVVVVVAVVSSVLGGT